MTHPISRRIAAAMVAAAFAFVASCADEGSPTETPAPDTGDDPIWSWRLQAPLPSTYDLYGVFATPAKIFAVGASGIIVTHDGERWVPQPSPTNGDLRGIHGTSSAVVWAVGDDGTAIRFDGSAWREINLESGEDLTAVWALSPDVALAASLDGVVFKYSGSDWSSISGDLGSLYGVWASADTNVYAVGRQATICHFNGRFWDIWDDPQRPEVTFRGVWSASTNDVLVVGDDGYAVRFDGVGWRPDPTPTSDTLHCVYGSGWGDPVLVGNNGTIVRDASTGWRMEVGGAVEDLFAVAAYTDAVDREHVVAVGTKTILAGSSDWAPLTRGTMHLLNDVWGDASDNVYVVGQAGTVLHFDGDTWQLVTTGEMKDLHRVWGTGSGISVADAAGGIHTFDGSDWNYDGGELAGGPLHLVDIWQIPGGRLVCVDGANGYYLDGRRWTPLSTRTTGSYLTGIWGKSNANIYAVALGGGIFRYNGYDWAAMDSQTGMHLTAVWGDGKGRVFAVGYAGTVLTYDGFGSAWTKMSTNMFHNLHRVWGTSGFNVLAVGDLGSVLRFNGFEWESLRVDTVEPLYGVWQNSEGDIYTVGGNDVMDGLIYRYEGTR